MPQYTNITGRAEVVDTIPEPVAQEIVQETEKASRALQLCKTIPMSSKTYKQPVMSALPLAYWVADGGLKETTEFAIGNKQLVAEEIATIIPIHDNTVSDSTANLWQIARDGAAGAIAETLDQAVFLGVNAPVSWVDAGIAPGAIAAGNTSVRGTSTVKQGGIAQDATNMFAKVWEDNYNVTGVLAGPKLRAAVASDRDDVGRRRDEISATQWQGVAVTDGIGLTWPTGASAVEAIAGDFSKAIIGVRQDVTMELFTEGVITDATGKVVLNLMQEDAKALRVVARYAFAIVAPVTRGGPTSGRFPFAVMQGPAS